MKVKKVSLILIILLLNFINIHIVSADNTITTDDDNNNLEEKLENTEELEEKVTSDNSNGIIYVEIFCGLIGVIMIVMANKTNG